MISKNNILVAKDELKSIDLNTSEISIILKEIKDRINCLIKLPVGKVVSGGQDANLKIWDITKKECLYTVKGHTSIICDIKLLNGNQIISACDDNTSKIWNLKDKTSEDLYKTRRHTLLQIIYVLYIYLKI